MIERIKREALKENISLEEKIKRDTEKRRREIEEASNRIVEDFNKSLNEDNEAIKRIVNSHIAPTEDAKRTQREKKPSNRERLAEGYIRATFEVNEEQLELIKALGLFKEMKQKDILEALIEKGLENISEAVKEEALKHYRSNNKPKENKRAKDLFN